MFARKFERSSKVAIHHDVPLCKLLALELETISYMNEKMPKPVCLKYVKKFA